MVVTRSFLEALCMSGLHLQENSKMLTRSMQMRYLSISKEETNIFSILSNHQELKEAIIVMLHAHMKAGQPLYARSIRNLIILFIQKMARDLLVQESSTSFKISFSWMRTFARNELNWSFRKTTTTTSKLPKYWELQGLRMTQRIAYLVKYYNVLCELVVNT